MDRQKRVSDLLIKLCLFVLVFFMFTIALRFVTRNVLVERLGMNNAFTEMVFFDANEMGATEETSDAEETENREEIEIDWAKLYPFEEAPTVVASPLTPIFSKTEHYKEKITVVKEKIETYAGDLLIGQMAITEVSNKYKNLLKWNLNSFWEYNGVAKLEDGYLTNYIPSVDVSENIDSIVQLNEFCKEAGCDFLYVQAPYKISKYENDDISGSLDYSNQNADSLIHGIEDEGVSVLDLREVAYEQGISHKDLFYRTDHHWKGEYGIWAAKEIAEAINALFGYELETDLLNEDYFEKREYQEWFLGSRGKKVTLAKAEPEDFTLIYPKFQTVLHYEIPSLGIDETGDFSITYDMNQVEEKDFYGKNPYGAYNYADKPLIKIENLMNENDLKILVIKDSFGNSVVPSLSLCASQTNILDLRLFDGSLRTYIKDVKPNVVVVICNPGAIGEIDWTSHTNLFDFR